MESLLTYYFRPKHPDSNKFQYLSYSTQLPRATLPLVRVSESGLQCTLSLFLQLKLGNGCTSFNPLSSDTLHMCVRACVCVRATETLGASLKCWKMKSFRQALCCCNDSICCDCVFSLLHVRSKVCLQSGKETSRRRRRRGSRKGLRKLRMRFVLQPR